MKIEGEYVFNGPRDMVWELLRDPDALASALPGTQRLNKLSDNEFEGVMNLRIGPVAGDFAGKLVVSDEVPPESCTLSVDGKGATGFVKGIGHVTLVDQGNQATLMKYDGDAQVGGKLAGVGQRLIDTVSKSMIRQGLEALNKVLEARVAARAEGRAVDYMPPSTSEFAAAVARDVVGTATSSAGVRILLYVVPLIIILAIIALILSRSGS